MSKALATAWTKHLESDKKDNFEKLIRNSTLVLTRLRQVLEEKERDLNTIETKLEEYDSQSWAFKQAHLNGRKAEIRETKQLLNFLT